MADQHISTTPLITSTPVRILVDGPGLYAVQADTDMHVLADYSVAAGTNASPAKGVKVLAGQLYDLPMKKRETHVGIHPMGPGSVQLFRRTRVER